MTTRMTLLFLTTGLLLTFLQGMACQEFIFKDSVQRDPQSDGSGNWTATGRLHLTNKDLAIFEPLVTVQAVAEVCSISLKSCVAHDQAPPTSQACYCTDESGEDFDLHMSGQGDLLGKKLTVQASVPSRDLFHPLSLTATIGDVPGADQQLVTCSNEVVELKKSLATMAAKLERLQTDFDQLNDQNSQLSTENSKLTGQNKKLSVPCAYVHTSDPNQITSFFNRFVVACSAVTHGSDWIVLQRRVSNTTDFYRTWSEYKRGFGDSTANFWLGLETIHQLTAENNYALRVDITYKGRNYYAHYNTFRVLGERDNYQLVVSGYSGDAGDSLAYNNGHPFSTRDRDHDTRSNGNCAQSRHGAWWYARCSYSNLNGLWASSSLQGLAWQEITGSSDTVSFSEMRIRLK